jgi:hypothetical protein
MNQTESEQPEPIWVTTVITLLEKLKKEKASDGGVEPPTDTNKEKSYETPQKDAGRKEI